MRIVGLILLFLAASLASLGGYFLWAAPDIQVTAPDIQVTERNSAPVPSDSPVTQAHVTPAQPSARDVPIPLPLPSTPIPKATAEAKNDVKPEAVERPRNGADKAADSRKGDLPVPTTPAPEVGATLRAERIERRPDPNSEAAKIKEKGKLIEQLPKGNIVLDAPSVMKVSEVRAVYANVGVNVPMDTLRQHVRAGNQTHEGRLAVSSQMIAVLSGSGFKITGTSPEQQSVAEGFPTVWSWDIEAKESGDQELEATLYALIPSRPLQPI